MRLDPEKQDRILDAATALFARFGFKKTSIDQIAAEAGVGKGTVYLLAKSKHDLYYRAVNRELRAWVAEVSANIDPREPADQLLIRCSFDAHRYLEDRPLVRELLLGNLGKMLPMWTEDMAELRASGRRHIEEILHLGIRQGRFRTDLDVLRLARLFQDMQAMGLVLAYNEKLPLSEQLEMGNLSIDVLLRGLLRR